MIGDVAHPGAPHDATDLIFISSRHVVDGQQDAATLDTGLIELGFLLRHTEVHQRADEATCGCADARADQSRRQGASQGQGTEDGQCDQAEGGYSKPGETTKNTATNGPGPYAATHAGVIHHSLGVFGSTHRHANVSRVYSRGTKLINSYLCLLAIIKQTYYCCHF